MFMCFHLILQVIGFQTHSLLIIFINFILFFLNIYAYFSSNHQNSFEKVKCQQIFYRYNLACTFKINILLILLTFRR